MLCICPQNITSLLELENIYKWLKIFFKCLFLHICWGFFFFSWERGCILEDVLLIPGEQNKKAHLRARLLSPGRSHVQRQGREGFVGGGGTCVLPADAASFGSEPPSCHWELGSVSGPSKWPRRWFWGDRTACVVTGSLKGSRPQNGSAGCGLLSRFHPGRQTSHPTDAQSSPAETPPRPIEATPSKNGDARTQPFLFTSSGQATLSGSQPWPAWELSCADRSEANVFSFVTLD